MACSLVADYDSNSDNEDDESDLVPPKRDAVEHAAAEKLRADDAPGFFDVNNGCVSSEDSAPSDGDDNPELGTSTQVSLWLPKPDFDRRTSALETDAPSVFSNPYREVEDAKNSLLERHVKMTPGQPQASQNKRICWNYRKGRCRFGHKCKFLHDSDIPSALLSNPSLNQDSASVPGSASLQFEAKEPLADVDVKEEDSIVPHKRKKPGISDSLIPPKRSVKAYQRQQHKERPWLSK